MTVPFSNSLPMRTPFSIIIISGAALLLGCSDNNEPVDPGVVADQITLSQTQVAGLTTRAGNVTNANPGNVSLRSFVDSTLLALQAGVTLKRLDVTTNLTTEPLYFVGIHRVINQAGGGSFSTWTLVGFEDPASFNNIIQASGFAQSTTATAPSSVSGTIGDGQGVVNGQLLQVAANGTVTTFNYSTGTASFTSDPSSGPCPNGNPEPRTVCTLETMHVRFTISATQSATSSLLRQASITTDVAVPAMRLTYTP